MAASAAAVIGMNSGKRLLRTSFYSTDLPEKFCLVPESKFPQTAAITTKQFVVVSKKSSPFSSNSQSNRHTPPVANAVKEHSSTYSPPSTADVWFQEVSSREEEDIETSLEAIILLQKSMLEKQWTLTYTGSATEVAPEESCSDSEVTKSGISARHRRLSNKKNRVNQKGSLDLSQSKKVGSAAAASPEFLQSRLRGYARCRVSEELLTHAEVVYLSSKIQTGLYLEEQRTKLKNKAGFEPSDKELAYSLKMSRTELQEKTIECSLAREKLTMSNIRLVMSIAQKYDNLGADMADLIQGGLIGLLRGIEKFDSSKGCRISTYVYWWIRQGVTRALIENSKALRLPSHMHERLTSIRNAKMRLEGRGITPSIDKIAESLNMSHRKIRNATEAVSKVISLDRSAFPSLNGLPGETLHSYVADNKLENNPWHGFDEWSVKDEVEKLLFAALGKRERAIIRLYYGLGGRDSHTWEDISRQFGLSRERVRQVGLVAIEKLKLAARKRKLEAMLVKH